jgi:hypothetical protein
MTVPSAAVMDSGHSAWAWQRGTFKKMETEKMSLNKYDFTMKVLWISRTIFY